MKITKYNKAKEEGSTGRITDSGTLISSPSYASAEVCDEAKRLKETHLIFGQPFNGTADVSGDISNAQNITASGGDLTVKSDYDEEGLNGGNIYADVDIEAGNDITAGNNVIGKKFIGDVEADDVTTTTLTAEVGNIKSLSGIRLNFNEGDIRKLMTAALTSVDIVTETLTVTK